MSVLEKEIKKLTTQIDSLKIKIDAAEKEIPQDRVYIVNLGQQLTATINERIELRKEKNILLQKSLSNGLINF